MELRATVRDHLVVHLPRQGQIRETIAVNVAHLFSPVPVLGATETVRHRFDA